MTSILTRGNEVRVNTNTESEQYGNSVTTLSDGRYVVTWQSYIQDGSAYGIYMQMFDASGTKIGSEMRVNTTTAESQSDPDIVALEGGGFVVAWQSYGQDGSAYGTYFQRYDDTGTAIGGETLINTTTTSDQYGVSLSALQGGGFVATWTTYGQDTTYGYGIYAKVFIEGGAAISPEFAVNTTTVDTQIGSQAANLSDGSFVVTWTSSNQDGSGTGVYMRRFNAFGTALTSETLVNTTTLSTQNNGDIIALANGGYVVSWEGYGSQADNIDTSGVFYQIYDANNTKVGGETLVNSYTLNSQLYSSMTALSDGGFVVTWTSYLQDGSNYGVHGQRYDENGSKMGPEFQVNSNTYSTQYISSVSALEDGGFVVTWTSDVQDGSFYGVYSRRYGAATTLSGTQYLYGTIENDLLDGGSGGDYMYGGYGDDTYIVNSIGDVVSENAYGGTDLVETGITYSLAAAEVENLTLTGSGNISGTGNNHFNVIIGNSGNNTIFGFDGNDSLFGGLGNDEVRGGDNDDYISGGSGIDALFGDYGNDEIYGDAGNDEIAGGAGNDTLFGGEGNDYISAISGNNQLSGDAGNDTLSGGTESSLVQGGAGLDVITGGLGVDTLLGGDDNDYFFASEGADFISGDSGVDTFDASLLSAGVNTNLNSGSSRYLGVYSTISGIENLIGSSYGDKLVGDAANNVINGSAGADTMIGGLGNDIYYYDNDGDTITETDGQGDDLLFSSVNVALGSRSVETVVLTGELNLTFSSSTQATEVWGNIGNNNINAGLGADTIYGGLGNDTIYVDDAGDVVVENADEGTDRVSSSITYTLGDNVENLTLTGTANINGTGNILANSIVGNNGNNRLDGGSGSASDSLRGGLGNDTYVFNLGFGIDDITNETGGADTILFGAGITSGMIIMQDVGADRYYAIDDGVHQASACANRIKIVGGAGGAVIETIAYTPPAAPALSPAASSAQLTQAIAALSLPSASDSLSSSASTQILKTILAANATISNYLVA